MTPSQVSATSCSYDHELIAVVQLHSSLSCCEGRSERSGRTPTRAADPHRPDSRKHAEDGAATHRAHPNATAGLQATMAGIRSAWAQTRQR